MCSWYADCHSRIGAGEFVYIVVFAANAGFLSGFSGIESIPGPELPQVDFLSRWNGMLMNPKLISVDLHVVYSK